MIGGGGRIIPGSKNKINMTKREQLFLYLLKHNYERNKYIVSKSVTEQGIQMEFGWDLSIISRLLKENENEEYIYRKLLKIENMNRRMNGFFLTDSGLEFALELKRFILKSRVDLNMNNCIQRQITEFE